MPLENLQNRELLEKDRILELEYIKLITRRIDARYKTGTKAKKINKGHINEAIDDLIILGIEIINEAKGRGISDPDSLEALSLLESSLTAAISHFYHFGAAAQGEKIRKFKGGAELQDKVESVNLLKLIGITRTRVKVTLALSAAAAAALVVGSTASSAIGTKLADDAVEKSKAKLAIAFYVDDPDLKGKPIGYIYGATTGSKDEQLNGTDKAITVKPELLEENKPLEIWYKALIALEDQGHEDGLSSYIGINERFPYAIMKYAFLKARSLTPFYGPPKKDGGSSIADQACGAMRSELADYRDIGSVRKKLEETLCGVGLAVTREPKEIAALYGTYGQVGTSAKGLIYFAWTYWGFEDIEDPHFTKAHQLILASMVNHTWACKYSNKAKCGEDYWEERLASIKGRANTALEILVAQKDITPEEAAEILKDIKKIEIPKPETIKTSIIKPKLGYASAIKQAIKEADGAFGHEWRSVVSSMTLSIDPNVQTVVYKSSLETLNNIKDPETGEYNPGVVSVVAVTNSMGEIVGIHYGNKEGALETDLFATQFQPGSMGKILLAAAVGNKGFNAPERNPYNNSFYLHLSKSEPAITSDAKRMKVKSSEVEDLINCYGSAREDQDQVESAALGLFDTSPKQFVTVLWEAYSGYHTPAPHIVRSFTVDGEIIYPNQAPNFTREKWEERSECSILINANHTTWEWLKAPLGIEGTLSSLNGIADAGKTGTDGPSGDEGKNNRMAWTIAAKVFDSKETNKEIPGTASDPVAFYTVIAGFGSTNGDQVPGLGTGAEVAAPVVKDVLEAVKVRFDSNALQIVPNDLHGND